VSHGFADCGFKQVRRKYQAALQRSSRKQAVVLTFSARLLQVVSHPQLERRSFSAL
jgi:hypothetical protein